MSKIVAGHPCYSQTTYSLMRTDAKLRSLKPKDAVYRVADSQGLCIEVRPSGSKIWRYRYRFAAKANMLSLGE